MSEQHTEGRPIGEIRAKAKAMMAEFQRLSDAWSELTEEQQQDILMQVEAMVSENDAGEES